MIELTIFIIGVCIGSFVNVLGMRLAKGKNIFNDRSVCDHCHKKLLAIDLIPVLSYFMLGGKCRFCHRKISIQYPIVELTTAFAFLGIYTAGFPHTVFLMVVFSLFLAIVIADWKYLIIPNSLVFALISISLLFNIVYSPQLLMNRLLTSIGAFAFLWIIYTLTRGKGMGFGDVKFSLVMGLLLGYPQIIIAFYIAFLTGAGVGIILLLLHKAKFGQHIPFGPFLVLATIVTFIWEKQLLIIFLKILGLH
ncbi:prepilin peptidase [Candidatus Gottesmanbacteria bacterium]|nr:prepilin peptidase [Candidatus Gottesmanbacteria bacterium]